MSIIKGKIKGVMMSENPIEKRIESIKENLPSIPVDVQNAIISMANNGLQKDKVETTEVGEMCPGWGEWSQWAQWFN